MTAAAHDSTRRHRHLRARVRRRRRNLVVAASSITTASLALLWVPAHPEAAGVLAIAAVALLAGQRWALGLVVVATLAVLRTSLPATLTAPLTAQGALGLATIASATPAMFAMRRGAASLALLAGERTRERCRTIWMALCVLALLCGCGALI